MHLLRQRLFNIGLLQLFILGIRIAPTVNLAKQIIQSRLNWNDLDESDTEYPHPILGDDEELTCLWKILDHTILLSCILCLLYGTREEEESTKVHKTVLLRFWILIAVMYNWGFCISTGLGMDWVNWTTDGLDFDLGQLLFVLSNSAILVFVARYVSKIGVQMSLAREFGSLSGVLVTRPQHPRPTTNPPVGENAKQ